MQKTTHLICLQRLYRLLKNKELISSTLKDSNYSIKKVKSFNLSKFQICNLPFIRFYNLAK